MTGLKSLSWINLFRAIRKIWMGFGAVMGWLMTRLILIVLFYLVLAPIGMLARIFGKVFLDTKLAVTANSYWNNKDSVGIDKKSYERQF